MVSFSFTHSLLLAAVTIAAAIPTGTDSTTAPLEKRADARLYGMKTPPKGMSVVDGPFWWHAWYYTVRGMSLEQCELVHNFVKTECNSDGYWTISGSPCQANEETGKLAFTVKVGGKWCGRKALKKWFENGKFPEFQDGKARYLE